ncbi:MAG TPA: hypothetical protein PKB10_09545, partial [Tepidisphaeraceae bacterium]|nr:hypothetical protein [Tepidisphaeraceae bacterium]
MSMTLGELELAISGLLDGTLPLPQRARLNAACEASPEARALLESYQKLDAIVRDATALQIDESAVFASISRMLDAHDAVDAELQRDPAAFASIDAALASLTSDRPVYDEDAFVASVQTSIDALHAERDAADAHPEYAAVDQLLRTALPAPPIDEATLHTTITSNLSGASATAAQAPMRLGDRIEPKPATTSRSFWQRALRPMSAAALLLLAVGVAFQIARQPVGDEPAGPGITAPTGHGGTGAGGGTSELTLTPQGSGIGRVIEFEVGRPGAIAAPIQDADGRAVTSQPSSG